MGALQPRGGDREQEKISWALRMLSRVTQMANFSGGRALENPHGNSHPLTTGACFCSIKTH